MVLCICGNILVKTLTMYNYYRPIKIKHFSAYFTVLENFITLKQTEDTNWKKRK
jgi:hypothetical protein